MSATKMIIGCYSPSQITASVAPRQSATISQSRCLAFSTSSSQTRPPFISVNFHSEAQWFPPPSRLLSPGGPTMLNLLLPMLSKDTDEADFAEHLKRNWAELLDCSQRREG